MISTTRRPAARARSASERSSSFEALEGRTLLHAGHFHAAVNFQPAGDAAPDGYVADTGATYAARNGLTYGWSASHASLARDRDHSASRDERYDTLIYMGSGSRWDLAVANGRYAVRVVAGDPANWDNLYRIRAEGTTVINGTPSSAQRWFDNTVTVNVYDGRLTITTGAGAIDNRINFLEVSQVETAGDTTVKPAAPTNFSATRYSSSGITLAWTDASNNEAGFHVERRTGNGGTWQQIATLGANVRGYDNTGLASSTTYIYRVRAFNGAGTSAYSNEDASTTLSGSGTSTPGELGTLRWSTVAADPVARSEGLSAVVGGKLYVLGGVGGSGPFARSDVYDPATNRWTRIRDLPRKLTHAGTAVVGNDIYLAGGYIGTASTGWAQTYATRDVWRYDVDANAYAAMPQLPAARGSGALVALGRVLHFVSGADLNRADRTDHWVLNLDNLANGWRSAAAIPNGKSHLAAVALNGKMYVIAGQKRWDEDAVCQSDVHVWDPRQPSSWTKVASLPYALSHHSSSTVIHNGRILVLGGETAPGRPTSKVASYDPAANRWTMLTNLPASRTSGTAGSIKGALYFAGGSVQTTTWKGTFS